MTEEREDSRGGQVLFAFLAGAAVGAVVMLLTTPKPGAYFRRLAADRLQDAGKQISYLPGAFRDAYAATAERTARAWRRR